MTSVAAAVANTEALPLLQLSELIVSGFRSLEEVQPLPFQTDLTVLTGENDGGKTATLDALGMLLGEYSLDSADRSRWSDVEPVEIQGVFRSVDDHELRDEVRVRVRAEVGSSPQHEILDLVHPDLGAHPADLPLPALRLRMEEIGIPSPRGNRKAPYVAAAEEWESNRARNEFEERWRAIQPEERARLPNFTRFDSAAAPSPTTYIRSLISREARRLLSSETYAVRLEAISEDLDRAIRPSLEHLKAAIHEFCPDLEAIEVSPAFDFGQPRFDMHLQVRREGESFDLEKAGEGRRRRVALAVHKANLRSLEDEFPTSAELIVYDEPDTHLDYGSQRELFEILRQQAALHHVQVIVATHSLNFIDKVPLQSLLHYRLREDLRTAVERLGSLEHGAETEFLASVSAGLGLRNSVLLDERCFLVVEGDTEAAAIPVLYRLVTGRSLITTGVTILNTKGSRSVRQFVEVLKGEWGRTVVVLADSDARDAHSGWVERLGVSEGSTLFYLGTKEFEDAFTDETWLRALEADFCTAEGEVPWGPDDLVQLRAGSAFGTDLRNLARQRCRDHAIGKPDLGASVARHLRDGELPDPLGACFNAVDRAAGWRTENTD